MTKIVLIGDVGGCADQLAAALTPLADEPGTVIIQVGDLVDRGPDSPGVLALVEPRVSARPARWIQLAGNHDAQYFAIDRFWPDDLDPSSAGLLRRWWLTERIRVAAAIRTADGEEFLVTHAGLSPSAWAGLDEPVTATTAADLLNTRPDDLLRHDHGPLWAEAGPDVYEPWLRADRPVPFSQIHGHSTIVSYPREAWMCGERIRERATVDWQARHTTVRLGGARFIGIDPKHGRRGAPQWAPLVLDGAELLA